MSGWVVSKFGGTSVASAERYKRVTELLHKHCKGKHENARVAVVVSAMAGVTNGLLSVIEQAVKNDAGYKDALAELVKKHKSEASELLNGQHLLSFIESLDTNARDIYDLLRAIWLSRSCSKQVSDLIVGHGELWSADLLTRHLHSSGSSPHAVLLDAREVLTVSDVDGDTPIVEWEESKKRLQSFLSEPAPSAAPVLVVTGFIARTVDGMVTTLSRDGSDYTASILAFLLSAHSITIWTDVDGVFSADPRKVPDAVLVDYLSYDEAMELTYFGAKVLHPRTMGPAINADIPLHIRNTFNPDNAGTTVHHRLTAATGASGAPPVKGISTVSGIALVNVEGAALIGVSGIASRIFGELRKALSVIMISQASSQHSICLGVSAEDADQAKQLIETEFYRDLHLGSLKSVDVVRDCTILAVVGDQMAHVTGIAGLLFSALGDASVNVRAIAQGSSERNISVVIDTADQTRALRAVHSRFRATIDRSLPTVHRGSAVGIIGPGLVGGELVLQLQGQQPPGITVHGAMNSRKMVLSSGQGHGLSTSTLINDLEGSERPSDIEEFVNHIASLGSDGLVPILVDCTSNQGVAANYPAWLKRGINVVTPNKKAFSSEYQLYKDIQDAQRVGRSICRHETSVGAALPVIRTLHDLVATGDKIKRIEGIFSGTLSYLFNVFSPPDFANKQNFSAIVKQAKEAGYTEPDARDDLSGTDVGRKVLILARIATGKNIELTDIPIKSLVPEGLQSCASGDEYLQRLPEYDDEMTQLSAGAQANNSVLRYVGVVDCENNNSAVELRQYPTSHPFASLSGSDNVVAFTTARYPQNPLIIQGAGAGAAVTASGVFYDLLDVHNHFQY